MKKMLYAALLLLTACANNETIMRNDAGQVRYCYEKHNGTIAAIGAVQEYNRCLNEAGAAGFRRVEK